MTQLFRWLGDSTIIVKNDSNHFQPYKEMCHSKSSQMWHVVRHVWDPTLPLCSIIVSPFCHFSPPLSHCCPYMAPRPSLLYPIVLPPLHHICRSPAMPLRRPSPSRPTITTPAPLPTLASSFFGPTATHCPIAFCFLCTPCTLSHNPFDYQLAKLYAVWVLDIKLSFPQQGIRANIVCALGVS